MKACRLTGTAENLVPWFCLAAKAWHFVGEKDSCKTTVQ